MYTVSSPSHRSFGFQSALSSPYDSTVSAKTRSHSRSISQIGALNPNASEFVSTFSSPNSPSGTSYSPATQERRVLQQQQQSQLVMTRGGGSSTPSQAGFSSSSPPSSVQSVTRSLDGSTNQPTTTLSPLAQQQQQQLNDEKLAALGLPSQPFDARELDAQIAREREDHAAYIYNFRVQVCQGWLDGNCPYDAYTCFQTHARLPRRRKPILQHGRFNYIPTRCRYVVEEKECPQGVHCRFSHVTEEVIYHASKVSPTSKQY